VSRRFVPLSAEIAGDWDDLVAGSPDGFVFSLAPWQRLILAVDAWGLRDHSFGYYENGRLVAVMPLQFSPRNGRMSSSGWGGSGPVVAAGLDGPARERVLRVTLEQARMLAQEAGASHLDMALSPVTGSSIALRWGVNPFVFHGFNDTSHIAQVIDLAPSEDELFGAVSAKTKPLLQRAADEGIAVRRVDWREFLDAYYDCHCETYTRTGVSPHPQAYFAGIAHEIAPRGHAVLFAAFSRAGEPIAFHNAARFAHGALYHTGCSRTQALELGANHLLLWRSILAAKEDGLRWFDVGTIIPGTDDPKLKGLTLFKTRFGGEPHRYLHCEMPLPAQPAAAEGPEIAAGEQDAAAAAAPAPAGKPDGLRGRAARALRRVLGPGAKP